MCTVLTDAPFETENHTPIESKCGDCCLCKNICPEKIITGKNWDITTHRDDLIDVYRCKTCLLCMVVCPWTQAYLKRNYKLI